MKQFLIFLFIFSLPSFSKENLNQFKYQSDKSLEANEKNFMRAMAKDCKDFGYDYGKGDLTPKDVMSTYPKEIVYLFYKKGIHDYCYYSVSKMSKYLISDFKEQTEKVLLTTIRQCFKTDLIKKPRLCKGLIEKSVLFDLTILLGNFCSRDTLSVFREINCLFKKVGENQCKLYQDHGKPLNKCPFYFTNQTEALNLHKSYYNKSCKKPRWIKPRCLK